MFRRVDTEMLPNPMLYRENENYIKTVALYKKSWELEQGTFQLLLFVIVIVSYTAGDVQGFTDTYLEGLALQCQSQRTVSKDTVTIFQQFLPYEIFMKIFAFLSVKDLCSVMVVSKVLRFALHAHSNSI